MNWLNPTATKTKPESTCIINHCDTFRLSTHTGIYLSITQTTPTPYFTKCKLLDNIRNKAVESSVDPLSIRRWWSGRSTRFSTTAYSVPPSSSSTAEGQTRKKKPKEKPNTLSHARQLAYPWIIMVDAQRRRVEHRWRKWGKGEAREEMILGQSIAYELMPKRQRTRDRMLSRNDVFHFTTVHHVPSLILLRSDPDRCMRHSTILLSVRDHPHNHHHHWLWGFISPRWRSQLHIVIYSTCRTSTHWHWAIVIWLTVKPSFMDTTTFQPL